MTQSQSQPPGFEAVLMSLGEDEKDAVASLVTSTVTTRHPTHYELHNVHDGTVWTLTDAGKWIARHPDPDPESESDSALLDRMGTDASVWAAELAKRCPILDGAPGSLLHNWFANAIEVGRTAGYWAGIRDSEDGKQQSVGKFLTEQDYV